MKGKAIGYVRVSMDQSRRAADRDPDATPEEVFARAQRANGPCWILRNTVYLPITNTAADGYGDFPRTKSHVLAIVWASTKRRAQAAAKKRYPSAKFGGRFALWRVWEAIPETYAGALAEGIPHLHYAPSRKAKA